MYKFLDTYSLPQGQFWTGAIVCLCAGLDIRWKA